MMSAKDYATVLRATINMEIESFQECGSVDPEEYNNGIVMGLKIALMKMNQSEFLLEN